MNAQRIGNERNDDISAMINEQFRSVASANVYANIINRIELRTIEKALEISCGNQVAAAKALGLHRNTLRNKIRKFNIDIGRYRQ